MVPLQEVVPESSRSSAIYSPAYECSYTLIVHSVPMSIVKAKKKSSKNAKNTKRTLVCAPNEQCFWTTDGKIIANLTELRDTLASMADDVFRHHVTKDRNDFATWIESVLQDPELAISIKSAKKPNTARAIVVRRLKEYSI